MMKAINFLPRILCIVMIASAFAFAQDQKPPTQGEQEAAKKVQDSKDLPAKMKQAEEFMKKNSKSSLRPKVAEYLSNEISNVADPKQRLSYIDSYNKLFTSDVEKGYIAPWQAGAYAQTDRLEEAFKLAVKAFEIYPDNVGLMVQLALNGAIALQKGNAQFVEQSKQYATKALEIIESDKKPAQVNDQFWSEIKTKWLPELHQSLGFFAYHAEDANEAKMRFEKAVSLNPMNINSYIMLVRFAEGDYQRAAMEYNTASGAAKDAALKKAYSHLDLQLEYYARVVVITESKPEFKNIHDQILPALQETYKIRKGSLDGLQQFIEKYKK